MGLFGVSETLNFEVPQFVRTLRVLNLEALEFPKEPNTAEVRNML